MYSWYGRFKIVLKDLLIAPKHLLTDPEHFRNLSVALTDAEHL